MSQQEALGSALMIGSGLFLLIVMGSLADAAPMPMPKVQATSEVRAG
jgi:hypothetical protein